MYNVISGRPVVPAQPAYRRAREPGRAPVIHSPKSAAAISSGNVAIRPMTARQDDTRVTSAVWLPDGWSVLHHKLAVAFWWPAHPLHVASEAPVR